MSPTSPTVSLPSPKEQRRLREALSLSEEQVAEAMGVTRATVRSWETGRSAPRGRKREAYAKLLGVYEEPTTPRTEQPARPAPAGTRPRPAAKGPARPPKSPAPAPAPTAKTPAPTAKAAPATAPAAPPAASRQALRDTRTAESPASRQERLKPAPQPAADRRPDTDVPDTDAPDTGAPPAAGPGLTPEEVGPGLTPEAVGPGLTPEEAFDALYAYAAPGLVHQTYLLTGRRGLSREAVEQAFHHAWQHWPEVAVDRDPVGWVRAAAYEYALSPWHRFRRRHRHPDSAPTEASRRALLTALLELPAPYRRTVLLYDGLGLDLPETAAETEASTPAAGNRLLHARTVIGQRVPGLADPEALQQRLSALVEEAPTATLPAARSVRSGSERRSRLLTRAVFGVTAALICVTAFTVSTAPTHYIPVNAPGEIVEGVPVRGGPQKLGPEDKELRDRLRSEPNPGPERLIPRAE